MNRKVPRYIVVYIWRRKLLVFFYVVHYIHKKINLEHTSM